MYYRQGLVAYESVACPICITGLFVRLKHNSCCVAYVLFQTEFVAIPHGVRGIFQMNQGTSQEVLSLLCARVLFFVGLFWKRDLEFEGAYDWYEIRCLCLGNCIQMNKETRNSNGGTKMTYLHGKSSEHTKTGMTMARKHRRRRSERIF